MFLYHAGVSWMPGGFLGVDLFFVLSGYLITSLLLQEFDQRGSIRLSSFWLRRARRLFPAVLLVIVFALLATLTIARDDLSRTRADALSALIYFTNWHEVIASHSYFSQFGRPSLLQHLWSLAVEEQFYLLWPLALIATLPRLSRARLAAVTAALAAASFALMWLLYSPGGDPSRLYYGTDTRAFTLLIGALLALGWPHLRARLEHWQAHGAVVDVVGALALVGVLALFVRVRDFDPWLYRGGFLVMAVTAAVLVAAATPDNGLLGRALGWEPLRWVGARSYGIYLWHWPVMQLTRPGADVPLHGAPLIAAQAAVTVGLAALSYRYVEMPIRTGAAQRRAKAWLDRHTPRQRLISVSATGSAVVTLAAFGFTLPAPIVAATLSRTATPSALQQLSPSHPRATGQGGPTRPAASRHGHPSPRGTGLGNGTGSGKPTHGRTPPTTTIHSRTTPTRSTPTKPDRHPSALPPGEILAVGDSVMLGCAPNLEQLLGRRLEVDAVVSRQAQETIARLAEYRAAGRLPSTVIVQIGNNGPVWYADMQQLRRVLRGVPRVVLVNVRLQRSWQNEVNQELKSYARTWPQAVLANWYTHSTWGMLSDGVHPSIAARPVYAAVVVNALKQITRKADRVPTGHAR